MTERLEKIRCAVETMHACRAKHEESVPILETFGQNKIGEGVVEVFALKGHPRATRCYAWRYLKNDEPHYVAVPELPLIDSAEAAVRADIESGQQK